MRVPNGQGAYGSSAAMQSFQMQAQQSYLPPPSSLESSNSLKNPDELFSLAEGRYVLRDEISLACPPPHPSEPPPLQPNPLASAPWVESNGTYISICAVQDPKAFIRPTYMPPVSKDSSSADSDADSATSDAQPTQPLFGMQARGEMKRRKPKNSMAKSNSAFISRIITHEHLAKRVAERSPEGLYGFININRSFQWLDLSAPNKAEPLAKILFTKAHPLCSDVNQYNKAPNHLDVLIGFNTGDIMWYDPVGSKYARINKNGVFNGSAVYDIRWIPGSESLFMVAHKDGRIMIYDTEKEDGPANMSSDELVTGTTSFRIVKRFSSGRLSKTNPVGAWEISSNPVYKIAFSPDATCLAIASEDGKLRVVDLRKERLIDLYVSYYGGFSSVAWSPDGRYLLSGGQDDLITIWSVSERRVVARCPGHTSWVTDIAFDPWGCEHGQYRFGSVGQDCRLLLWDFTLSALHRPKTLLHSTRMGKTAPRPRANSNMSAAEASVRLHAPESRGQVATLMPIVSKQIDASPLLCLHFRKDCLITSSRLGKIRTWDRPKDEDNGRVWDD